MKRTLWKLPLFCGFMGIVLSGCASSSPTQSPSPSVAATPPASQTTPTVEVAEVPPEFPRCVANLKQKAAARGLPAHIIAALDTVKPDTKVVSLDRKQPEFVQTFWDYLDKRVTQTRIDKGRRLLIENAALLNSVHRTYGVPPEILVSFWGLESNYGAQTGTMDVVRSLTTLACDGRRSAMFTTELMNALQIAANGDADVGMKGSWAGAMGQTQFMPSTFLRYAVDGDGDGKRDLWNSLPDVFASSGNFLRALGWKDGQKWGEEVLLPSGFDVGQARAANRKPLSHWKNLGVKTVMGGTLAADGAGSNVSTAIIMPMGREGPAFAIYPNFDVIMKWNRSTNYAIAVGHLADRIKGAGPLVMQPAPDAVKLRVSEVMEVQERLNAMGYEAGEIDGTVGPVTSEAITAYQKSQNMPADGYPNRELLQRLRLGNAALQGEAPKVVVRSLD